MTAESMSSVMKTLEHMGHECHYTRGVIQQHAVILSQLLDDSNQVIDEDARINLAAHVGMNFEAFDVEETARIVKIIRSSQRASRDIKIAAQIILVMSNYYSHILKNYQDLFALFTS